MGRLNDLIAKNFDATRLRLNHNCEKLGAKSRDLGDGHDLPGADSLLDECEDVSSIDVD